MPTLFTSRRAVKPVTGTARWLATDPAQTIKLDIPAGLMIRRHGEPADSPGTAYMVSAYRDGSAVSGYRLEKLDGKESYDIDADFQSCTCPDHTFRGRACKHLLGLRSALASVGLI